MQTNRSMASTKDMFSGESGGSGGYNSKHLLARTRVFFAAWARAKLF